MKMLHMNYKKNFIMNNNDNRANGTMKRMKLESKQFQQFQPLVLNSCQQFFIASHLSIGSNFV